MQRDVREGSDEKSLLLGEGRAVSPVSGCRAVPWLLTIQGLSLTEMKMNGLSSC